MLTPMISIKGDTDSAGHLIDYSSDELIESQNMTIDEQTHKTSRNTDCTKLNVEFNREICLRLRSASFSISYFKFPHNT